MAYRYKGRFISKGKYKRFSNLLNVKNYLSKISAVKPPQQKLARKKPALVKEKQAQAFKLKEVERETRRAIKRDSKARYREIQERAKRKREQKSKQGLIIRDLEESDAHGPEGTDRFVKWSEQATYNLRITRIRKTYQPGYKKVHRSVERDTRYTKAVLVEIPFSIGPGSNANEEMEVFMEKLLGQYSLAGDEEFYGTVETRKRKIARTIAKRQEIPMELRRVRHRSKPR